MMERGQHRELTILWIDRKKRKDKLSRYFLGGD